jgi:putative endonuclease
MATDNRRPLGALSEDRASHFLRGLGYEILERNARTRWGELDIVARDGSELVFVEVKARRAGSLTAPVESVTPQKVRRLVRLAEAYLAARDQSDRAWRIDVVALVVRSDGYVQELTHIPNAVELA